MPDGGSIAALILGMIGTHMKFALDLGMVWIAESPLYEQNGNFIYLSDGNVDQVLDRSKPYTRFKGLGELNPKQAKKIFFDVGTRRLHQVTLDGLNDALSILSSSNAKKMLMTNRGVVTNPYNL